MESLPTQVIKLKTEILIKPYNLIKELDEILYKKLCDKFINKCSKKNGYVLSINPGIQIEDNTININGNILFKVIFLAKIYKPKKDQVVSGDIYMIIPEGIIINIIEDIKVFISVANLKGFKYNEKKQIYERKSKNETFLKLSQTVKIVITDVIFENLKFKCIGKLF